METQIIQVSEKLQLILASGVAKSLAQHIEQTNQQVQNNQTQIPCLTNVVNDLDATAQSEINTLASISAISNTEVPSQPTVEQGSDVNPESLQQDEITVAGDEVEIANSSIDIANTSTESTAELALLPPADMVPIYVKSCSRRNFAVLLIRRLVDKDVRRRSNVNGKGKEKLDPAIVKYVKSQCFEYYPCQAVEVKKEWANCIISIDESCRRLNKQIKSSSLGTVN